MTIRLRSSIHASAFVCFLAAAGAVVTACGGPGAKTAASGRAPGDPPALLVQDGHTDAVGEAAFSDDGDILATASVDRTLRLFQARTGRVVQVVPHESMPVLLMPVPRTNAFLTVTEEGTARLVDAARGEVEVLAEVAHHGPTHAVMSADGARFAVGSRVGDAQLAALDPSARQLRAGAAEGAGSHVQVFALATKRLVATLPVAGDQNDLAVSTDGAQVVVALAGAVELWDVATAKRLWSIPVRASRAKIAADGSLLLSTAPAYGADETIVVAAKDGATIRKIEGRLEAISPSTIVTSRYSEAGHALVAFDGAGKELGRVRCPKQVTSVHLLADGTKVLLGDTTGALRLYATNGMKELATRKLPPPNRRFGVETFGTQVRALATSPRLGIVATGRPDGRVLLMEDTTLAPRVEVTADKASVSALELSLDGKRLAVGDDEGRVTVWSLETGERIGNFRRKTDDEIARVDLSPTGDVVEADGEAFVVATGAPAAPLGQKPRMTMGRRTFLPSADGSFTVAYGRSGVDVASKDKSWTVPNSYETSAADVALDREGRLVVASRDPVVHVYDAKKETEIAKLVAHTGSVTATRFSADGKILATGSLDGTVTLWRVRDFRQIATIHLFENDEWITTTPRGAYVASSNASVYVNWVFRRPLEAFGFDQFARALERPEIVAKRLAGGDDDVTFTHRPPSASFADGKPYLAHTGAAEDVVRARVSSDGPSSELRAFVDGREVDRKALGPEGEAELHVPLLPGTNRITVVGYDHDGFSSAPLVRNLIRDTGREKRPTLHLVAIGIDRYPRVRGADLDVAKADARATVAAFENQVGALYGALGTKEVLLDDAATPAAILRSLDALAQMAPTDLAVVSFAGHGVRGPGGKGAYFVTGAFDGKNLAEASVAWAETSKRLARARGRVLVLVDACHSGSFAPGTVGPSGEIAAELGAEGRSGVVVFAASKGRQESLEFGTSNATRSLVLEGGPARIVPAVAVGEPGHGAFTGALVEGLAGAAPDADGSGAIELGELETFVVQRVWQLTRGRQSPWIARREMVGDFVVAERPKR